MNNRVVILSSILLFSFVGNAQPVVQAIQRGNDLYKIKEYEAAAKAYEEAMAKDPSNLTAKFNWANTAYRLSKPDDAIKSFDDIAFKSNEAREKAKAFYNKGVILSNQKKLEESIAAYKDALRQDPNDKETRENLQKALLELKKKNPPPKKEDNKKKQQQQNKKQQQQPKMNEKDAEQKLKLLEQKEKELQQRLQKQKSKTGTGGTKDW